MARPLQLATVASSLFYAVWSLYTGFLITKPNIPGWWIWFYYLCPGAYCVKLFASLDSVMSLCRPAMKAVSRNLGAVKRLFPVAVQTSAALSMRVRPQDARGCPCKPQHVVATRIPFCSGFGIADPKFDSNLQPSILSHP